MMLAAYGLACIALGCVIGSVIGVYFDRRRDRSPAPIDLSYDTNNPINGRFNVERTMNICGAEWTVYGGVKNGEQ